MQSGLGAAGEALRLLLSLDSGLMEIVVLSLEVTLTAVALAAMIGMPLGALIGALDFKGRGVLIVLINALMGLPPVVVGLAVYLALTRSGPLGVLQLLYTPTAMIIAQTILVLPILTALTRQTVEERNQELGDQLKVFGLGPLARARTLLWEGRSSLITALLAGFGRAIAEVGAVIIVGGNINHVTRTMTTAIALETSKGELALAMGLGFILLTIAIAVNATVAALGANRHATARA